jgi:hypothetical protein
MTPLFTCTDRCTTRRGAQYAGDPARDLIRLLWETDMPYRGLIWEGSWGCLGGGACMLAGFFR